MSCKCQICGTNYKLDLTVPDVLWEKIKPDGKDVGAGLLCGKCIVDRVEALGAYACINVDTETKIKKVLTIKIETLLNDELIKTLEEFTNDIKIELYSALCQECSDCKKEGCEIIGGTSYSDFNATWILSRKPNLD